ncbi:hypothetical protein WJX73_003717 [Symbiochloris irregularis]|uniref:Uncharacterized protein n=1 Tax=Symbiochloris irregularis TaxID=706552 RepID=A0AAW1NH69_9CHLO
MSRLSRMGGPEPAGSLEPKLPRQSTTSTARFADSLVIPEPALPRQGTTQTARFAEALIIPEEDDLPPSSLASPSALSPSVLSPARRASSALFRAASVGLGVQKGSGVYGSGVFGQRSVLQQVLETSWDTDEEHLERLSRENDIKEREVELFTQYLSKNKPRQYRTSNEGEPRDKQALEPLNIDERCEVAASELEAANAVVSQVRSDCDAKAAELIIQLRLLDIDMQRAERDVFDLKRSFLKPHGTDSSSSTKHRLVIEGDKLLAFVQARKAAANESASKLAVKLAVTKEQGRKAEVLQKRQKELKDVQQDIVQLQVAVHASQQQADSLEASLRRRSQLGEAKGLPSKENSFESLPSLSPAQMGNTAADDSPAIMESGAMARSGRIHI